MGNRHNSVLYKGGIVIRKVLFFEYGEAVENGFGDVIFQLTINAELKFRPEKHFNSNF